jgi:uncharacterized protein
LLEQAGFPPTSWLPWPTPSRRTVFPPISRRKDEARIVQDADRMDALGAIGLARMFYTSGRMGRQLAHPDKPLGEGRHLDDREYALDHIEVKLENCPA